MHMSKKVRILGIIPARGGSKSIPYKNIALLNGKPLISYAIKAAQESKLLDALIISTDDEKIKKVAEEYGADVPFLRPKKYAQDMSRDIEYLQHALTWLEKQRGWTPEIVVMLQPTTPWRTGKDIDDVVKFMLESGADSVRTMIDPGHYNPFKMWVEVDAKTKKIVPMLRLTSKYRKLGSDVPRQLLPTYYLPFGLVYVTKSKFIKKGRVLGNDVKPYLIDPKRLTDIDSPEDLLDAARLISKLQ